MQLLLTSERRKVINVVGIKTNALLKKIFQNSEKYPNIRIFFGNFRLKLFVFNFYSAYSTPCFEKRKDDIKIGQSTLSILSNISKHVALQHTDLFVCTLETKQKCIKAKVSKKHLPCDVLMTVFVYCGYNLWFLLLYSKKIM